MRYKIYPGFCKKNYKKGECVFLDFYFAIFFEVGNLGKFCLWGLVQQCEILIRCYFSFLHSPVPPLQHNPSYFVPTVKMQLGGSKPQVQTILLYAGPNRFSEGSPRRQDGWPLCQVCPHVPGRWCYLGFRFRSPASTIHPTLQLRDDNGGTLNCEMARIVTIRSRRCSLCHFG